MAQYALTCGGGTVLQKGGKFNLSKPMSDVDWMVKNAKCQPGPQDYNADASNKVDPRPHPRTRSRLAAL